MLKAEMEANERENERKERIKAELYRPLEDIHTAALDPKHSMSPGSSNQHLFENSLNKPLTVDKPLTLSQPVSKNINSNDGHADISSNLSDMDLQVIINRDNLHSLQQHEPNEEREHEETVHDEHLHQEPMMHQSNEGRLHEEPIHQLYEEHYLEEPIHHIYEEHLHQEEPLHQTNVEHLHQEPIHQLYEEHYQEKPMNHIYEEHLHQDEPLHQSNAEHLQEEPMHHQYEEHLYQGESRHHLYDETLPHEPIHSQLEEHLHQEIKHLPYEQRLHHEELRHLYDEHLHHDFLRQPSQEHQQPELHEEEPIAPNPIAPYFYNDNQNYAANYMANSGKPAMTPPVHYSPTLIHHDSAYLNAYPQVPDDIIARSGSAAAAAAVHETTIKKPYMDADGIHFTASLPEVAAKSLTDSSLTAQSLYNKYNQHDVHLVSKLSKASADNVRKIENTLSNYISTGNLIQDYKTKGSHKSGSKRQKKIIKSSKHKTQKKDKKAESKVLVMDLGIILKSLETENDTVLPNGSANEIDSKKFEESMTKLKDENSTNRVDKKQSRLRFISNAITKINDILDTMDSNNDITERDRTGDRKLTTKVDSKLNSVAVVNQTNFPHKSVKIATENFDNDYASQPTKYLVVNKYRYKALPVHRTSLILKLPGGNVPDRNMAQFEGTSSNKDSSVNQGSNISFQKATVGDTVNTVNANNVQKDQNKINQSFIRKTYVINKNNHNFENLLKLFKAESRSIDVLEPSVITNEFSKSKENLNYSRNNVNKENNISLVGASKDKNQDSLPKLTIVNTSKNVNNASTLTVLKEHNTTLLEEEHKNPERNLTSVAEMNNVSTLKDSKDRHQNTPLEISHKKVSRKLENDDTTSNKISEDSPDKITKDKLSDTNHVIGYGNLISQLKAASRSVDVLDNKFLDVLEQPSIIKANVRNKKRNLRNFNIISNMPLPNVSKDLNLINSRNVSVAFDNGNKTNNILQDAVAKNFTEDTFDFNHKNNSELYKNTNETNNISLVNIPKDRNQSSSMMEIKHILENETHVIIDIKNNIPGHQKYKYAVNYLQADIEPSYIKKVIIQNRNYANDLQQKNTMDEVKERIKGKIDINKKDNIQHSQLYKKLVDKFKEESRSIDVLEATDLPSTVFQDKINSNYTGKYNSTNKKMNNTSLLDVTKYVNQTMFAEGRLRSLSVKYKNVNNTKRVSPVDYLKVHVHSAFAEMNLRNSIGKFVKVNDKISSMGIYENQTQNNILDINRRNASQQFKNAENENSLSATVDVYNNRTSNIAEINNKKSSLKPENTTDHINKISTVGARKDHTQGALAKIHHKKESQQLENVNEKLINMSQNVDKANDVLSVDTPPADIKQIVQDEVEAMFDKMEKNMSGHRSYNNQVNKHSIRNIKSMNKKKTFSKEEDVLRKLTNVNKINKVSTADVPGAHASPEDANHNDYLPKLKDVKQSVFAMVNKIQNNKRPNTNIDNFKTANQSVNVVKHTDFRNTFSNNKTQDRQNEEKKNERIIYTFNNKGNSSESFGNANETKNLSTIVSNDIGTEDNRNNCSQRFENIGKANNSLMVIVPKNVSESNLTKLNDTQYLIALKNANGTYDRTNNISSVKLPNDNSKREKANSISFVTGIVNHTQSTLNTNQVNFSSQFENTKDISPVVVPKAYSDSVLLNSSDNFADENKTNKISAIDIPKDHNKSALLEANHKHSLCDFEIVNRTADISVDIPNYRTQILNTLAELNRIRSSQKIENGFKRKLMSLKSIIECPPVVANNPVNVPSKRERPSAKRTSVKQDSSNNESTTKINDNGKNWVLQIV